MRLAFRIDIEGIPPSEEVLRAAVLASAAAADFGVEHIWLQGLRGYFHVVLYLDSASEPESLLAGSLVGASTVEALPSLNFTGTNLLHG
ncbi:hypothetical protein AB0M28_12935 [Streptomyces sp. NPDC051940]|uniref:hypothetical protein n=1 Tax=Streptomyces sp. NPDC051940 TaxID=3155675 RepID=UPI003440267D